MNMIVAAEAGEEGAGVPETPEAVDPLGVGATIPPVAIRDLEGETVYLDELVREKPAVIIFYRGGWCPYCNLHLAELKGIEVELRGMGYQLIAISPDRPEKLRETKREQELGYALYSDSKAAAIVGFGLGFRVPESLVTRYKRQYGIDLEADSGEKHHILPVPAVYIVKENGKVIFAHSNPDYKNRINLESLLTSAKTVVGY